MKFKGIVLAIFCAFAINGIAQSVTSDSATVPAKMGEAYLSESKKIGVVTYGDATLNIFIRKERNFITGQVSKSVFFSGTNNDGAAEGYIELTELSNAISALKFINDSLLPRTPENEVHFAKRFINSSFVIYTSYSLISSTLFSKNEWDVVFQLSEKDYTGTQGVFHIRKQDVPKIVPLLQSARERLATF